MQEVLFHYGHEANRNKMLNCPFHEDKTPSMQMYPESDTVYCFSSNCELRGKSIDQIDFIMHKERVSKSEAINKAKELARIIEIDEPMDYHNQFPILRKNLLNSPKAQKYIKERKLSDLSEIGYNYNTLGELKNCVIFPLKDKAGKIVSLYGRSINEKNGRHYYSRKRKGLYPSYPSNDIETIILTESIIDAQTVMDRFNNKNIAVLALYGTNGLTSEHIQCVSRLQKLREIIFFMDGDLAGEKSTEKYSKELNSLFPDLTISKVITPEGEDPNSLVQNHEEGIIHHLIENRTSIYKGCSPTEETQKKHCFLETNDPSYLHYHDKNVTITILGGIHLYPVDRLKVTLKIEKIGSHNPLHKLRHTLDLYNDDSFEKLIKKSSEKLDLSTKELQITQTNLIEELEQYREEQIEKQKPKTPQKRQLTEKRRQKAIDFLSEHDLLKRTNDLIGQSGVVGEETNRLLMYLIFTSRLREHPLHIISLGASGTGKTYLQEKISQLIPEDHKLEITTLSENALYYFEQTELKNKLVLIEDLDGAQDDKILYALRELMSKKQITKTIPIKDTKGNLKTITLQVEGPISLSGTTTREKLYEDNANRSILIYLYNSKTHKEEIMDYQRQQSSGRINKQKEEDIKETFKDIQSVLKPIKVINPYAEQLIIPETDFKPLRTNSHYLSFIEVITYYKQYQREIKLNENVEEYIETTLEDIKEANELLKEVLLSKSDELTKASRNFLETIKVYLNTHKKDTFYSKELRSYYRLNPNTLKRYLRELRQYGYIRVIAGTPSKGYEYELEESESYTNLQKTVETSLEQSLQNLKVGQWVSSGSVAQVTH